MALPGPAAKAARLGHSANADWTEVVDVPFEDGVSRELLPLGRNKKWHALVVRWWKVVRIMPHCVLWNEADWIFAEETALMKHEYISSEEKHTTAATEIRRREDQMGTTLEARRKLRIRYVEQAQARADDASDDDEGVSVEHQEQAGTGNASVTPLASRRARLTRSA